MASLTKDDKSEIESKTENLMKASQKLSEMAYSEGQSQTTDTPNGNEEQAQQSERSDKDLGKDKSAGVDDVVDADFKEVKRG